MHIKLYNYCLIYYTLEIENQHSTHIEKLSLLRVIIISFESMDTKYISSQSKLHFYY